MALFGSITADNDLSQLPGTTGGSNANTGAIGEVQLALVSSASAVALSNGVAANVASIVLTAGDWDVEGIVTLKFTSATNSGDSMAGLSATSATLPGDSLRGYNGSRLTTTTFNASICIPANQFISNGSQTINLVALAAFSAGSCAAFGNIRARRIR